MSAVHERSALAHPDFLSEQIDDEQVWDHAVALLLHTIDTEGCRTDRYSDTRRVFTLVAAETARIPPTSRRCADLAALVVDLRTGAAACLEWAEYEREAVLDRLLSVLRSPPWLRTLELVPGSADSFVPCRNRWLRDVLDRRHEGIGRNHFEIHVVRPVAPRTPAYVGATTRILLDGRPIIADLFPEGAGRAPEKLLRRPGLWATEQPRTVRLAEAYCGERCCGALYVTIVREGDLVVWRDWALPMSGGAAREFRFPAYEYDVEVAGAEHDHSWEWVYGGM